MSSIEDPNPHVPPKVAAAFMELMAGYGHKLSADVTCLRAKADRVVELELFNRDHRTRFDGGLPGTSFDLESGLSAYIGETLIKAHDGLWTGFFAPTSGMNFYTAKISFGGYDLYPSHWPAYRISNGPTELSFAEWLDDVLPSIQAREDLRHPRRK